MVINLPGFPDAVTDTVDLPDIGELLMYPAFQGITADDFMKHACENQKLLFDKIPLKNDKKHVTVRFAVSLLEPGVRSHVSGGGKHGWHIDGAGQLDHIFPDDRVFILSSHSSALTEFCRNPVIIDVAESETRQEVANRVDENPQLYGVHAKAILPNRFYMFQNHLHRAVEPCRVEFRFFMRVRETNLTQNFRRTPLESVDLTDRFTGDTSVSIEYSADSVKIRRPRSLTRIAAHLI